MLGVAWQIAKNYDRRWYAHLMRRRSSKLWTGAVCAPPRRAVAKYCFKSIWSYFERRRLTAAACAAAAEFTSSMFHLKTLWLVKVFTFIPLLSSFTNSLRLFFSRKATFTSFSSNYIRCKLLWLHQTHLREFKTLAFLLSSFTYIFFFVRYPSLIRAMFPIHLKIIRFTLSLGLYLTHTLRLTSSFHALTGLVTRQALIKNYFYMTTNAHVLCPQSRASSLYSIPHREYHKIFTQLFLLIHANFPGITHFFHCTWLRDWLRFG